MNNVITKCNNGMIHLDCRGITDKMFMDAYKTKNIVHFKIMSRKSKSEDTSYVKGGPDVLIRHITGERQFIYRRELISNYLHASGNKIVLSLLKNDKDYIAYSLCNEACKVIKLPNNCIATLPNGRKTKPGSYIIAKIDSNGQVDKMSMTAIPNNIFKKMFRIPLQDIIKRHIGKTSRTSNQCKLINRDRATNKNMFNNKPILNKNSQQEIINNQENNKIYKNKIEETKYKYRVTRKVMDMNGKILGFEVQEIASGKTRNLTTNELTQLCMNKLVENVMVVRNQKGTLYLKGNGCSLENLPQVIA